MIGKTWEDEPINNICNIILQDASTNQIDIGNRRPSDYISDFAKTNSELCKALKDHLIYDVDSYGINNDDFDTFVKYRAAAFIKEIESRLKVIKTDSIDSSVK